MGKAKHHEKLLAMFFLRLCRPMCGSGYALPGIGAFFLPGLCPYRSGIE
jgi:hypothetical protein